MNAMYRLAEITRHIDLDGSEGTAFIKMSDEAVTVRGKTVELQISLDEGKTWDTVPTVKIDIVDKLSDSE